MPSDPVDGRVELHLDDFTEDGYRRIVTAARDGYRFEPFGTACIEPHVLWRHDVDVSVQRGLRLAQIEHEEGVAATYFFHLHSEFYNLMERAVVDAARAILGLGHHLGLHFDTAFYGIVASIGELDSAMTLERTVLGELLGATPHAVSFHNPNLINDDLSFDADTVAGMINAYGADVRARYAYISDSNGYWRHQRLPDVLAERAEPRLHVLTHPEWWQAEAMPPRQRIARAVEGRAAATSAYYDAALARAARFNAG